MNFFPPQEGENVPLICLKCHNHFSGPNPSGNSIFEYIFKMKKRTKCPECGSFKVIRNLFVFF